MKDREFYSSFVRLHILYHASRESIYGLGIMEELARHGYVLSAGTLYPILHGMEQKDYLVSCIEQDGKSSRRVYRATKEGKRALSAAKIKVKELFGELFEDE